MDDKLEISETNKEKNQIIVNRKYKFNLCYITDNTKVFKCTENKTVKKNLKFNRKLIYSFIYYSCFLVFVRI